MDANVRKTIEAIYPNECPINGACGNECFFYYNDRCLKYDCGAEMYKGLGITIEEYAEMTARERVDFWTPEDPLPKKRGRKARLSR